MAFKPKSDKEQIAETEALTAPVAPPPAATVAPVVAAKNAVVEIKKEAKHVCCVTDKEKSDLLELVDFLGQLLKGSNSVPVRVRIKHFQAVASAIASKE